MSILNGIFYGNDTKRNFSSNVSGNFGKNDLRYVVLHYTGSSKESAEAWLTNKNSKASAHMIIGREGSITQLVPFDQIAWHAGASSYNNLKGLNKHSIGIELENFGKLNRGPDGYTSVYGNRIHDSDVILAKHKHQTEMCAWHAYTEVQINRALEICNFLKHEYNIKDFLGHDDIAPKRKQDPGPAFPLEKFKNLLVEDRSKSNISDESFYAKVVPGLLNIRIGPSLSSNKASDPLIRGEIIKVVGETDGWCKIEKTTKISGWVSKKYLNRFKF